MRIFHLTQADKSGHARRFSGMASLAWLLVLAFLLFSPGMAAADEPDDPDWATAISLDYVAVVGADGWNDQDWFQYTPSADEDVRFEWNNTNKTSDLVVLYYTYETILWWTIKTTHNVVSGSTSVDATVALDAGETYYVGVIHDHGNSRGNLRITRPVTVCYEDADGDGFGNPSVSFTSMTGCAAGYVPADVNGDGAPDFDCNDDISDINAAAINPAAAEVCDGIDNNCNGITDEGCTVWYKDGDNDGYGDESNTSVAAVCPASYVGPPVGDVNGDGRPDFDCNDDNAAINPAAEEVCGDGIDNNCDLVTDEVFEMYYYDEDDDGYGTTDGATAFNSCGTVPDGWVAVAGDCDDTNPAINPGAVEVCDGLDNDCDGDIDEGLAVITYYQDMDGDGYGNPDSYINACAPPENYVTGNTDCDDNNAFIHPGAFDPCDTDADENCSGDNSDCSDEPVVCANLSSVPLETQVESAKPLVVFLIDDSGSMAWDLLCAGETDGKFNGQTSYSKTASYWKTQWAGFNGVYYDPDVDYTPWADSSVNTYTDASTSGFTSEFKYFYVPGPDVSVKWAHYYVMSNNGTPYLVNITSSGVDYYEVVQGSGGVIDDLNITVTPPADVTIDRTVADELQNIANWYEYYRTRQNTAKAAIGKVINSAGNMLIGLHTLHGWNSITLNADGEIRDVDAVESGVPVRKTILTYLYKVGASSGTPLRLALKEVGDFYDQEGASSPFSSDATGGACQQAFAVVMTDGYYNDTSQDPGVDNADSGNSADDPYVSGFDGGIYGDGYSDTLADIAMYYYEKDLNDTLANVVPTNDIDTATHQHMVSYTISFGLDGLYNHLPIYANCGRGGACPAWADPHVTSSDAQYNEEKIDDLWHAAVNGRGSFMEAKNAQQLAHTLTAMMQEVTQRRGSGASVAVNTQTLEENTRLFQGSYNSAGWTGELAAYAVDSETGAVGDKVWSAADQLKGPGFDWAGRKVFTTNDSTNSGVAFTQAGLSAAQLNELGGTAVEQQSVINYIRGDISNASFRSRVSTLLGDIVHSAPVHVGDYVYVGANDGMMHVFDAATGAEVLAYIPSFVYYYDHLRNLTDPDYNHHYFVDSTPYVSKDGLLIGGLGRGGKGYYALDVSDLDNFDPAYDVLWEWPTKTTATAFTNNMGYSYSVPFVVESENHGRVMVFGNGYDSPNASAVLFVIGLNDDNSTSFVKPIDTGYGNPSTACNGLSTPLLVDTDYDGKLNFVYAGDLQGNLWKFDLQGDMSTWGVAYTDGSGNDVPLFQARDAFGHRQPITTTPGIMRHCRSDREGYILVFGTGSFMSTQDFGDTSVQTIYGIWDWTDAWADADGTLTASDLAKFNYGAFLSPASGVRLLSGVESSPLLTNPDVDLTLLAQTEVANYGSWRSTSANKATWFAPDKWIEAYDEGADYEGGLHVGWYFDLPLEGERVIADATIRSGLAIIVSVDPSPSPCETGGNSWLTILNACDGSVPPEPALDTNDDGVINDDDMIDDLVINRGELDDIYYKPVILPGMDGTDLMYFDAEDPTAIQGEATGMVYWRFVN